MRRREMLGAVLGAAWRPAALRIEWREGPEYPMGIQDSAFAMLNGKIVSAGGFTRHPKDILATYPDIFEGKKSGFTKATFIFDPARPGSGWSRIADLPGPARQGAAAVTVGKAVYVIGGFNYDPPHCYRGVYRLEQKGGNWVWSKLDADLPWPLSESGAAVIGSKIFLVSAADFYAPSGGKDQDFSVVGRGGDPVGKALIQLDTANLHAGWKRLADLPGTPRFDTCAAAVAGKICVLSGVYRDTREKSAGYANVVDSWCYDPSLARWFPLPDMPHISNQRAVAWRDHHLILLGNYRYRFTRRPDGRIEDVYTPEERTMDWKQFFGAKVMVFDAKTNRLFETDPLLDRTSLPMAAIAGDTVYTLGGEGGTRLWHPATFQIGRIWQAQ